jgi:anti-sigma-K factor RskA
MAHNERFEELAALQALGVPLGAEGAEFARHLAECGVCAAIVEEGAAAAAMLAIEAPPVTPRPALRARILDEIAAEAKGGVRPAALTGAGEARRGFPRWALALAAALALLFLLVDDARIRREREELRSRSADLVTRLDSAQRSLARRDLQVRVLESEDVRVLFLGG